MFLAVSSPGSFDTSIMAGMQEVFSKIDADQRCIRVFHQDSPKPVEDSFIESDDRGFYLFEGVVVNDGELINQYALLDVKTLLKTALSEDSMRIIKQLHGQFCGLYIDLEARLIRAFTNQISSLRVFYYQSEDLFIAGTSIRHINQLLKANQISTSIDEAGARMVMTYGFMLSDYTTIAEIKHLNAGQYVTHRNGRTLVESYHSFDNEPKYHDEKQILPRLNELFSSSVRMSFEKDIACGKIHLAFLSGGLDSRQVVMTANQLAYKDVTCLNFTQPGYADELIARKITRLLKYQMLFYSLDKGTYLLNLEDNLRYNEGQVLLHGAAHLYAGIASIDNRQYGIFHSGQLGDAILGSYLKTTAHTSVDLASGAYSTRLFDSIYPQIKHLKQAYANNEMFLHYNRAFNGVTNGDHACADYSYSISPFTHPEFFQLCLNISPALRSHNLLYNSWMKAYNPLGASIRWEKTGSNLYAPQYLILLNKIFRAVVRLTKQRIYKARDIGGMNPFDKWWHENADIRGKFGDFMLQGEGIRQHVSKELWDDIVLMSKSSVSSEKLQAYSVIAGLDYILNTDG